MSLPDCRCGHPHAFHLHYRVNDDCGHCGRRLCPTYKPYRPPRLTLRDWWWLARSGIAIWRKH